MLGSPPGHVKPTSSGHRGGVGAFINTVVPKFTHKIYIIFNFKKKAAIQILIFMYRHSGGEPIAVESFHKSSSHRQIHAVPVYFVIPIKTKDFPVGFFFFSFFFLFFGLLQKAKINCCFCTIYGIFPFSSQFLHIHVKTFYIYNIPGKIKLHTPWIFCHSSNTPVEL